MLLAIIYYVAEVPCNCGSGNVVLRPASHITCKLVIIGSRL